jgi:hypothetical protein
MILDYKEDIRLRNDNPSDMFYNEIQTLKYLSVGLRYIFAQVYRIEQEILRKAENTDECILRSMPLEVKNAFKNQMAGLHIQSFGNDPSLPWVPRDLIACAFHWYAVSVYNYVSLVGWLANLDPKKYANKIIPQVVTFRNKVAAHFARWNPRKDDTTADLDMSVLYPIVFCDDAFYVGVWKLTKKSISGESSNTHDLRWSLTKTHLELVLRYWPNDENAAEE